MDERERERKINFQVFAVVHITIELWIAKTWWYITINPDLFPDVQIFCVNRAGIHRSQIWISLAFCTLEAKIHLYGWHCSLVRIGTLVHLQRNPTQTSVQGESSLFCEKITNQVKNNVLKTCCIFLCHVCHVHQIFSTCKTWRGFANLLIHDS